MRKTISEEITFRLSLGQCKEHKIGKQILAEGIVRVILSNVKWFSINCMLETKDENLELGRESIQKVMQMRTTESFLVEK